MQWIDPNTKISTSAEHKLQFTIMNNWTISPSASQQVKDWETPWSHWRVSTKNRFSLPLSISLSLCIPIGQQPYKACHCSIRWVHFLLACQIQKLQHPSIFSYIFLLGSNFFIIFILCSGLNLRREIFCIKPEQKLDKFMRVEDFSNSACWKDAEKGTRNLKKMVTPFIRLRRIIIDKYPCLPREILF